MQPVVHSPQIPCNSQGWAMLTPGNFTQVSHGGWQRLRHWDHHLLLLLAQDEGSGRCVRWEVGLLGLELVLIWAAAVTSGGMMRHLAFT